MQARAKLAELAAPDAEAVITTTEAALLRDLAPGRLPLIPLRAGGPAAQGHLTLEPLDGYFDGLAPPVTSDEASLRLLHTRRVVLIGGAEHKPRPQVYGFPKVLDKTPMAVTGYNFWLRRSGEPATRPGDL